MYELHRIKFLVERIERIERRKTRGEIGFCRECGKSDPQPPILFCRRRRCKDCRERARSRFLERALGLDTAPKTDIINTQADSGTVPSPGLTEGECR